MSQDDPAVVDDADVGDEQDRDAVDALPPPATTPFLAGTFGAVTVLCVIAVFGLSIAAAIDAPGSISESDWDDVQAILIALAVGVALAWSIYLWSASRGRRADRWDGQFRTSEEQLYFQALAMSQYLHKGTSSGVSPRPEDVTFLAGLCSDWPAEFRRAKNDDKLRDELEELVSIHDRFSALVSPASPGTLVLLYLDDGEHHRPFPWLGSVRLVRQMIGLAVVLVSVFVVSALFVGSRLDSVNGLFGGSAGEQVQTAVYLLSAAGIGAAFAALSKSFKYIRNLSYDVKYESSYWIRFVQGIVAGLILSIVIAQAAFGSEPAEPDGLDGFRITVPLLALIGGFSSDLVYRLLQRIIDAIEALISGSASERVERREQEISAEADRQALEARASVTGRLLEMKTLAGMPAEAQDQLDQLVGEVLSGASVRSRGN